MARSGEGGGRREEAEGGGGLGGDHRLHLLLHLGVDVDTSRNLLCSGG